MCIYRSIRVRAHICFARWVECDPPLKLKVWIRPVTPVKYCRQVWGGLERRNIRHDQNQQ